jgi:hypothetical protein
MVFTRTSLTSLCRLHLTQNKRHTVNVPDLTTCDFWFFSKLKNALKGQRFAAVSDIQCNTKTLLRVILENDFQDCFWQWHHHLTQCIASQGKYFEGDSSH